MQTHESTLEERENIVTVKALVLREGRMLCIQDAGGRWDAPGGRMDIPESIVDALRREVREELGVDIATIDGDHPWVWYWTARSRKRPLVQNIIGIGFPCTLASDDFVPAPPEAVAHAWHTAEELRALDMHDGHKAGYLRWMELQGAV
ncbi:MAG: NUDIX hydrolase [bacterium]|nr:NUDIX hydrolase [bacterium]